LAELKDRFKTPFHWKVCGYEKSKSEAVIEVNIYAFDCHRLVHIAGAVIDKIVSFGYVAQLFNKDDVRE
jgi:hypothetical protein